MKQSRYVCISGVNLDDHLLGGDHPWQAAVCTGSTVYMHKNNVLNDKTNDREQV